MRRRTCSVCGERRGQDYYLPGSGVCTECQMWAGTLRWLEELRETAGLVVDLRTAREAVRLEARSPETARRWASGMAAEGPSPPSVAS